uniref:Uncharacterized protein n=1 Tax=Leptospira mayottensis 200901116 TaxID=1192864 RepID=A0A343URY9_9LEPT|nr:hypothetical protein [Leptospira mayottensis 200901116]
MPNVLIFAIFYFLNATKFPDSIPALIVVTSSKISGISLSPGDR